MITRFYRNKVYWVSIFSAFILILAILLPFYLISLKNKDDTINKSFETTSRLIQHDVSANFQNLVNNLDDISRGFGILKDYNNIDEELFDYLIMNIDNSDYYVISYAPVVYDSNRSHFESLISNIYNNTLEIKYLISPGVFNISEPKELYYTIIYSNAAQNTIIGVDLLQSFNRKQQLMESLNTKTANFANVTFANSANGPINIIPLMYPVIDVNDNINGFLAIAFKVETYFKNTSFTNPNLNYAVLTDDVVLFSTNNIETIELIHNNDLVNVFDFTILNKMFKIVVYGGDDFKKSVTSDDNDVALIVGIILFILIMILITLLFHINQKSNDIIETNTRQTISKTYDRIVSYFSHEMRSPLNTIQSLIYYLNMNNNNNKDDMTFEDEYTLNASEMTTLYESVHRIKHFVDEMLSYQKMADGKMNISVQKHNIVEFCTNILSNQSINCPKTINVQLLISKNLDDHPNIYIDTIHLSQVILNGLSNAIKFTNDGYIILRLHVKNIDKYTYLSLEILNTGIGLLDINPQSLFVPFSQGISKHSKDKQEKYTIFNYKIDKLVKQNVQKIMNYDENDYVIKFNEYGKADETSAFAKQNGSGMGMPISKMLSISMGGDLTIQDEFENGKFKWTNFHSVIDISEPGQHINVPMQDYMTDLNNIMNVKRCYSTKFDGLNMEDINNNDINILLIDDTPGNLETGEKIFSKLGYNIDTLSDGIFIDYSQIFKYDIILLDIIMTQSTGMDICSRLIKYKYNGIILATTGFVSDNDIMNYNNHGFNGVYAKPFKIPETDKFFKTILIDKKWNVLI